MIYNFIIIPLALLFKKVMGFFNPKLREREKNWKRSLSDVIVLNRSDAGRKRIWFHSASMGEFEQAKPIIELIKRNHPDICIIVSFFSPSGYNNQKNYEFADAVVYLPFDRMSDVKYFLDIVKPNLAVFVRYEVWRNFLSELNVREVPIYLIDATAPDSKIMREIFPFSKFTSKNYDLFQRIYTVDEKQTAFFEKLRLNTEIITLTDTRFDRIAENVRNSSKLKLIPDKFFRNDDFVLVLGSSWSPDEEIAFKAVDDWNSREKRIVKLIVVPHEPTPEHIGEIIKRNLKFVLLSEIENRGKIEGDKDSHILVDSIGKLLSLYSYANAAYIGGAFGVGVHSVTEPAGYGIPLATGLGMKNSPDAVKLREIGALKVLGSSEDFRNWLNLIVNNREEYQRLSHFAKEYIDTKLGSSESIYKDIIKGIN